MKDAFYPGYILVYPDIRKSEIEPSGGYVEVHIGHHSHESVRNTETAVFLAKRSYKVRLLPIDNTPDVKNPDVYLPDEQLVVEFKHNQTPTTSAIENEIRDGKRQADYVLIHVKSDLTKGALIRGLRLQIHRAVNLKEVWIIFQEELFRFTPDDIRSDTIVRKIQ